MWALTKEMNAFNYATLVGPMVPTADVLQFVHKVAASADHPAKKNDQADDRVLATVVCYACHPVTVGRSSLQSTDYSQ